MEKGLGRFQNPAFVACLVSAVAAVIVTLPSVTNGFVYDDVWIVQRNEVVHDHHLKELLQSTYWPENRGGAMWRPAALVGFGLQWALGGGGATIFHVVNIGLYSLVTGLVALLGVRLFSPTVGLVGGLLFAVHPVHVEVTANIVGQAELIAAAGYLAAMLAMWQRGIRDATGPRAAWLGAAVLGFAIGLGGKEHGLTFPGAVLILWWLVARRRGLRFNETVRREWVSLVPLVLVALAYLVLRAQVVGGATSAGGIATGLSPSSILERAIVMLPVSMEWLRLLFFPVHLSADYSPLKLVPQATFGFDHAMALAHERGLHMMGSYHELLVRGVASYSLEMFSAAPDLDALYVPIGLGSGVCAAIAARDALNLKTGIVGVVSEKAAAYALSFEAKRPVSTDSADTFADGVAVRVPDPDALEVILAGVERVVTVSDQEILAAMGHYFDDTHNIAEGAGAAPLAALLKEREAMRGKKIGLVLSGGNLDRDLYMRALGKV